MKVGTDAMLIGAFADPGDAKNILDIGTGTGVLSLMLAQKIFAENIHTELCVDAIEIDAAAAEQAKDNFANSPWGNNISIQNISLQDFTKNSDQKYDFIISNPPFFEERNEEIERDVPLSTDNRKLARSFAELSPEELIKNTAGLLANNGRLCIIYPFSFAEKIIGIAIGEGLNLHTRINIRSYEDSPFVRCILEFGMQEKEYKESSFVIYDSHRKYSDEYKELTREFHGVKVS